jgi:LysM repeat protein
LVACAGAVVALVADTLSASDEPAQEQQRQAGARGNGGGGQKDASSKAKEKPEEYVVEPGDTLSGIAEKTGVPIERIMRRNPDLDPRVLNAGQVIKLR